MSGRQRRRRRRSNPFAMVWMVVSLSALLPWAWAWACRDSCGNLQVKYPFGTGAGCGDPRFQNSVSCVNQKLMFTSHSGSYPIVSIDYTNTLLYVADPRMSTCTQMQKSGGFGLDWTAPFTLQNDVFLLLNCNTSSSLYNLCDSGSAHICTSLYTCLGIPQFTSCCVYIPVNLGSANEVNLAKLGCESYTSIYNFGEDTVTDPMNWSFGIKLQYNYNLNNNNFPIACALCEKSNGVCGFTAPYNPFVCVCRNGVNTTTDCSAQDYGGGGGADRRACGIYITGILIVVASIWRFIM